MIPRSLLKKFHYLYCITRSDGAYYIGIHSTDDLHDGYFGSGQRLRQSVKKHGKMVHNINIVEMLESREALLQRERDIVIEEMLRDPLCMNLRRGGGATAKEVSGTTRERLSASAVRAQVWRNAMSPEANAKRKASLTGKKKSTEHVRRSAAARLANMTDETRWKLGSGNRNRPQTAEANAQRSASLRTTNATLTQEQRSQRTETRKMSWSPERRAAASVRMKQRHAAVKSLAAD